MDWARVLAAVFAGFAPVVPTFLAMTACLVVIGCPMPGRGPRLFQRQDPWRSFKYESRRVVSSSGGPSLLRGT